MKTPVIGWDIGGAHLKAVALNTDAQITAVLQQPCPLWKGIEQLRYALTAILRQLPVLPYRHAITMTGELVDCFANRDEGVQQLLTALRELLPEEKLFIFAGWEGLLAGRDITPVHYAAIASANWLASASFAAQKTPCGLFVDIGSTTTDILLFDKGKVLAQGYSDYQRLVSQELIYTGIVRTAVMAVVQTVRDNEQDVGVMAEYFATMVDVYRLTGELNEAHDQTDTADGAEKSPLASAKRLARMIGCDGFSEDLARWQQLAAQIRARQLQHIQRGCERQLARLQTDDKPVIVGAGVGRFLIADIAQRLVVPYIDFTDLSPRVAQDSVLNTADCAPALAIACLLLQLTERNF